MLQTPLARDVIGRGQNLVQPILSPSATDLGRGWVAGQATANSFSFGTNQIEPNRLTGTRQSTDSCADLNIGPNLLMAIPSRGAAPTQNREDLSCPCDGENEMGGWRKAPVLPRSMTKQEMDANR